MTKLKDDKLFVQGLILNFTIGVYQTEQVLEALSTIGHCPNLLNDDNGRWALSGSGYQTVVTGNRAKDVETAFFVEKKYWKKTIRQAVLFYLKELLN